MSNGKKIKMKNITIFMPKINVLESIVENSSEIFCGFLNAIKCKLCAFRQFFNSLRRCLRRLLLSLTIKFTSKFKKIKSWISLLISFRYSDFFFLFKSSLDCASSFWIVDQIVRRTNSVQIYIDRRPEKKTRTRKNCDEQTWPLPSYIYEVPGCC